MPGATAPPVVAAGGLRDGAVAAAEEEGHKAVGAALGVSPAWGFAWGQQAEKAGAPAFVAIAVAAIATAVATAAAPGAQAAALADAEEAEVEKEAEAGRRGKISGPQAML